MIGDAAQYQELVALYASYGDNELVELTRGIDDLTDMAQQALRGEISRRGLTVPVARESDDAEPENEDDVADLRAFAALAPAECVFEYEDGEGAAAATMALREAGINSVVLQESGLQMDVRPRVVVAPEHAEDAATLLSQPLTKRYRAELEDLVAGEFAMPPCPECGGHETVLEAVQPANQWRCDDCDHSWLEDDLSPEG